MTTADASQLSGRDLPGTEQPVVTRQERMATDVAGVRRRSGLGGSLLAGDRWMLVVGGTLLPLGALLVLLGWVGASRTVLVFEQVPYLISGGLLGLSLVVAGGFVYFAYWLTLLVREARTDRVELTAALGRIEMLLAAGIPTHEASSTSGAPSVADLVATRSGTMLHRRDCPVVEGRDGLRRVTAETTGLSPCRICEPLLP